MNKDLYFLPLITQALQQPLDGRALVGAFEQIRRLGREPDHERGYGQFLRFVAQVEQDWEQSWCSASPADAMDLVIDRDGEHVGIVRFSTDGAAQTVADVRPGHYRLSLATGLCLWRGLVTQQDVLWEVAFPGEPLRMAAATERVRSRPTKTVELESGELMLRFFAGLESGWMELTWTSREVG